MMQPYWLIALLLIAALAWFIGRSGKSNQAGQRRQRDFSRDYLVGLNYLLSEQPDKAVDIFTRLLEADSDTIETHLALGHLFRRRGEVERAIRIHQNLIAKPQLTRKQRVQAMTALGQDYLRVGVLDRAERLLLDVVESGDCQQEALSMLLEIYQQEKEWEKAIQIAEKLQQTTSLSMDSEIAHYNCELAHDTRRRFGVEQAQRYLKRALATDKNCVRASLISGEWELEQNEYKAAIRQFKKVAEQDPTYISEIVKPLAICFDKLGQPEEYTNFLHKCLADNPRVSILLALSENILKQQGIQVALDFVAEQLYSRPSLYGLSRLIDLQKQCADGPAKYNLQLLFNVTQQLIKQKPIYRCGNCGHAGKILDWHCPGCHRWGTIKPILGLEGE